MDSRDDSLKLDIGCLQKTSFKTAKFLGKRKFQSYVICGEVVEWSMRQFFKEYIGAVVQTWCGIIGFIFELVGFISGAVGITILIPYWVWVSVGIAALIWAQFLVYDKVRKQRDEARNEVASAISELELNDIKLGGQSINMAQLFWKMGGHFLEGIQPGTIPGTVYKIVEGTNEDACREAFANLKRRLRLLKLIEDKQRWHRNTGYIEIVLTPLGASVLNELEKKYEDKDWSTSASGVVSNKEGAQG